jgi:hypothetical protein
LAPADLVAVLDAAGVGWWEFDHAARRLRLSPSVAARFTRELPEPAGNGLRSWFACVHPQDRARVHERFAAGEPGGPVFALEFRFEGADGDWRWLVARGRTERGADGRAACSAGVLSDQTDERHREALYSLQQTFARVLVDAPDREALFDAIVDAVLCLPDFDGAGLYWRQPDGGYRLVASRGFSRRFLERTDYFNSGSPQAAQIATGGRVCSCVGGGAGCTDPALVRQAHLRDEGLTALVALPVEVNGSYVASLNLASHHLRRTRRWTWSTASGASSAARWNAWRHAKPQRGNAGISSSSLLGSRISCSCWTGQGGSST